jgi:pimeloyl-ACP methyl ester carboxylesterase
MVEIARHMVGWPFCELVPDRYDNVARLDELRQRRPRPAVTILHGAADAVVPVQMGRSLAARYPDWIEYIEIPRATHRSLLNGDMRHVLQVMAPRQNNPPGMAGLH